MKSGNLNFLEPSGPLQACNGTALPFTVYALHVSGGFSAHHQELKNCTHSIWYVSGLLAAAASVVEFEIVPTLALFWCSCPLLEDVIVDILEPV